MTASEPCSRIPKVPSSVQAAIQAAFPSGSDMPKDSYSVGRSEGEAKEAVSRLVHSPIRIVLPRWTVRRRVNPARHFQLVVAGQTPMPVPDQPRGERGVVVDRHGVAPQPISVSLVVVGKSGVAGAVAEIVDSPSKGVIADAPIAGIQGFPVVAVVQGIRPPEGVRVCPSRICGDRRHRGRRRGLQERPAIHGVFHRLPILPRGPRRGLGDGTNLAPGATLVSSETVSVVAQLAGLVAAHD